MICTKVKEYKKEPSLNNDTRDYGIFSILCLKTTEAYKYFNSFDGIKQIKVDLLNENILLPDEEPLNLIKNYIDEKDISKKHNDSLWIILDTDHWNKKQLQSIARFCNCYKNINLAASNPCFDIWLLYHHYSNLENLKCNTRDKAESILSKISNSNGLNKNLYMHLLKDGIKNASMNDTGTNIIPEIKETKVHELTNDLLKRLGRNLFDRLLINNYL